MSGDREIAKLPELLGFGVVACGRLVQDVGAGALEDGHVVVGNAIPLGNDEHPDGLAVADLLHRRRSVVVLGAFGLRGVDLLLVELGRNGLSTCVGIDTGPPQLPDEEQRDDEAGGDEQLTDPGQGAIEDSYSTALTGRAMSHKPSSCHRPSSRSRHHRVSRQSMVTDPARDQPGVVDVSQSTP